MADDWSTRTAFSDTGICPQQAVASGAGWTKSHVEPIDLITISREFGSGGSDVARALGARLQWQVLDRELVLAVATRLGLHPRHIEPVDECTASWLARLVASALLMSPPEQHVDLDNTVVHPDAVAEAARAALLAAVQSPPLIVVGHGAQCLFRGRPGTLHVRLVAPMDHRIDRICGRETCDRAAAAQVARRMDDARRAYVRRHYHIDLRDPLLYDLQLNTGTISLDACVELIAGLVTAEERQTTRRFAAS